MLGDKPVIRLGTDPKPVPSVVLLLAIVGFGEVLQQTPFAVTGEPFSAVTFTPLFALPPVMPVIAVVFTAGSECGTVVKLISLP